MNIGVIGLGYVGLTTALGLSSVNHTVFAVEINSQRLEALQQKRAPFYEENLDEVLKTVLNQRFFPSNNMADIFNHCNIILICVDTPAATDSSIDLSYIRTVIDQLAIFLQSTNDFRLFVIKSTVVPGTTYRLAEKLEAASKKKLGVDFSIAMVPEFLREGSAFHDFINPDRIVLGVYDEKSLNMLQEMYTPFSSPKIVVDLETAEFCKYASNCFLAMKISFANELANLVDAFNLARRGRTVNIDNITKIMGYDPRIGPAFLKAGVGYGGSCFPKDVKAFSRFAAENGVPMTLLEATDKINSQQPLKIIEHLLAITGPIDQKHIGILGLSFKPNTDDIREAPSRKIISELLSRNAYVHAWDPVAEPAMAKEFPTVHYHVDIDDIFQHISAVIIVTEWPEIKEFLMRTNFINVPIIDGRGIYPNAIRSIGRSKLA